MFKIYTSSNFINDLKKHILKSKFSVELIISEDEFKQISQFLINESIKGLLFEIIICSKDKDKSIRTFNILKTLVDNGVSVLWNDDDDIIKNESYFLISDKTIIINKNYFINSDSEEDQVRYINAIFDSIVKSSEPVVLNNENISINFFSNKTIVKKNEIFEINWKVESANSVKINPFIGEIDSYGKKKLKIINSTLFELTAKNSRKKLKKNLFIRVLNYHELNLNIYAYDKSLNEYLKLEPVESEDSEKYGCYFNQKIKILWDFKNEKSFQEENIGNLDLKGEFTFTLTENKNFKFMLESDNETQTKKIKIIGFENQKNLI